MSLLYSLKIIFWHNIDSSTSGNNLSYLVLSNQANLFQDQTVGEGEGIRSYQIFNKPNYF